MTGITAEELKQVREPIRWRLEPGARVDVASVVPRLRRALCGLTATDTPVPGFLLDHQRDAFRRITAILHLFGGACLCDAVGLGKTFIALAVATRYKRVHLVLPKTIVTPWQEAASRLGISSCITTHETLSRTARTFGDPDLIIVDEAHRFRNPRTQRYDRLSRNLGSGHVLLVTATPIVNTPRDLLHLLRLFLPDHGLAMFGVRSLERALAGRVTTNVLKSVTPLLVARSPRSSGLAPAQLPLAVDLPIVASTPLPERELPGLIDRIQSLEFPAFRHPEAPQLLRAHLLYRLHSSVRALRTSLERHRAYLDRATWAAEVGTALTRRDARSIFDPDDDQLDLQLVYEGFHREPVAFTSLHAERGRIDALLHDPSMRVRLNPKLDCLIRYLSTRARCRTIIFVNAVPTALEIAQRLEWKHLATVVGGKARIASGALSLDDAVSLFAPIENNGSDEPARMAIHTLITTDILSEGVNLQAADAVVHYDLPWTPLRLQQRIGRVRRLGSRFATVSVLWFVPHALLERRLGLQSRLHDKLEHQMRYGVPVSTAVGRAHVANRALEQRELLVIRPPENDTGNMKAVHAVVGGPAIAGYAVRWLTDRGLVPDVIFVEAEGVGEGRVLNLFEGCRWLIRFAKAPSSTSRVPVTLESAALRTVRQRLADGLTGPAHSLVRKITRSIITVTRSMRGTDDIRLLCDLDRVLDVFQRGTRIGGELELREILDRGCSRRVLRRWVRRWPPMAPQILGVEIDAILFGDGSRSGRTCEFGRYHRGTDASRLG